MLNYAKVKYPRLWCSCGNIPADFGYHTLNCPHERVKLFDSAEEWWEIEGEALFIDYFKEQLFKENE